MPRFLDAALGKTTEQEEPQPTTREEKPFLNAALHNTNEPTPDKEPAKKFLSAAVGSNKPEQKPLSALELARSQGKSDRYNLPVKPGYGQSETYDTSGKKMAFNLKGNYEKTKKEAEYLFPNLRKNKPLFQKALSVPDTIINSVVTGQQAIGRPIMGAPAGLAKISPTFEKEVWKPWKEKVESAEAKKEQKSTKSVETLRTLWSIPRTAIEAGDLIGRSLKAMVRANNPIGQEIEKATGTKNVFKQAPELMELGWQSYDEIPENIRILGDFVTDPMNILPVGLLAKGKILSKVLDMPVLAPKVAKTGLAGALHLKQANVGIEGGLRVSKAIKPLEEWGWFERLAFRVAKDATTAEELGMKAQPLLKGGKVTKETVKNLVPRFFNLTPTAQALEAVQDAIDFTQNAIAAAPSSSIEQIAESAKFLMSPERMAASNVKATRSLSGLRSRKLAEGLTSVVDDSVKEYKKGQIYWDEIKKAFPDEKDIGALRAKIESGDIVLDKSLAKIYKEVKNVAHSPESFKYNMLGRLGEEMGKKAIELYGVKSGSKINQINNIWKNINNMLFLADNPIYALNNVLNNAGTGMFTGLTNYLTNPETINRRMGWTPTRVQQTVGDRAVFGENEKEVMAVVGRAFRKNVPGHSANLAPSGTLGKVENATRKMTSFGKRFRPIGWSEFAESKFTNAYMAAGENKAIQELWRLGVGLAEIPQGIAAKLKQAGVLNDVTDALEHSLNVDELHDILMEGKTVRGQLANALNDFSDGEREILAPFVEKVVEYQQKLGLKPQEALQKLLSEVDIIDSSGNTILRDIIKQKNLTALEKYDVHAIWGLLDDIEHRLRTFHIDADGQRRIWYDDPVLTGRMSIESHIGTRYDALIRDIQELDKQIIEFLEAKGIKVPDMAFDRQKLRDLNARIRGDTTVPPKERTKLWEAYNQEYINELTRSRKVMATAIYGAGSDGEKLVDELIKIDTEALIKEQKLKNEFFGKILPGNRSKEERIAVFAKFTDERQKLWEEVAKLKHDNFYVPYSQSKSYFGGAKFTSPPSQTYKALAAAVGSPQTVSTNPSRVKRAGKRLTKAQKLATQTTPPAPVTQVGEAFRHTGTPQADEYMKTGGWKIHLKVDQGNYSAVDDWLDKNHPGLYKLSPQGDSDFTVYVGSKADVTTLAQKIETEIGNFIQPKSGGTDLLLTPKVSARFDVQKVLGTKYKFYGTNGVPFDRVAADAREQVRLARQTGDKASETKWNDILQQHTAQIDKDLRSKYGNFYDGIDSTLESQAVTQTPGVAQASTETVLPQTYPLAILDNSKIEDDISAIVHRWIEKASVTIDSTPGTVFRDATGNLKVDPGTLTEFFKWLENDYIPSMIDTKQAIVKLGEFYVNQSLLNYNARHGYNDVLNIIYPYEFWYTSSIRNWAKMFISRPEHLARYARTERELNNLYDEENFPTRLRGKIKFPMSPSWGSGIFIDPIRSILPIDSFLQPLESANYESQRDRLTRELEYARESGANPEKIAELEAQIEATSKPDAMDTLGFLMSPGIQIKLIQSGIAALTGKNKPIDPLWAGSRYFKQLTSLLGKPVDIEGGMRGLLPESVQKTFPVKGSYDTYRVKRSLRDMVMTGEISQDEANDAMVKMTGEAWEKALTRSGQQDAYKGLLKGEIYPTGEKISRGLQAELGALYDKGDKKEISGWYKSHPEYLTNQMLFDMPGENWKRLLSNKIWNLPELQRTQLWQNYEPEMQKLKDGSATYADIGRLADAASIEIPELSKPVSGDSPVPFVGKPQYAPGEKLEGSTPEQQAIYDRWKKYVESSFSPNISDKYGEYIRTKKGDDETIRYAREYATFKGKNPEIYALTSKDEYGLSENQKKAEYEFNLALSKLPGNLWVGLDKYYGALRSSGEKAATKILKQYPEIEMYWELKDNYEQMRPDIVQAKRSLGKYDPYEEAYSKHFQEAKLKFGRDIFDIQNEYYSIKDSKGQSVANVYKSKHPELQKYWDWNRKWKEENPAIVKANK